MGHNRKRGRERIIDADFKGPAKQIRIQESNKRVGLYRNFDYLMPEY